VFLSVKRVLVGLAAVLVMLVAGCGGADSPTTAPQGVTAVAGDSTVTVSWTAEAGLRYSIVLAQAAAITFDNYAQFPAADIIQVPEGRNSLAIGGLTNGKPYAFVVLSTRGGSPAGPGSPSVSATPRLAGINWTTATPIGTADLNGLSGVISAFGSRYVVAGNGGFLSTSTDASTWTTITTNTTVNLRAVSASGIPAAVGDAGTVVSSSDYTTWAVNQVGGGNPNLRGIDANFGGTANFTAVGDGGAIFTAPTSNRATWTQRTSGTTQNLNAVRYSLLQNIFIAVGDGGTILTSTDAITWTARTSNTTANLRGIVVLPQIFPVPTGTARIVAVGDGGTIVTSEDGITWTARTSTVTANLLAGGYASQFVVVGANGTILNSLDGVTWNTVTSGSTAELRAVLAGFGIYLAVGTGGTYLTSR
jgi:hypothetical protein